MTEQYSELGYKQDAELLALHLLGRAQGVSVIAHVCHDTGLLKREAEQLQSWIERF